jgi:tetratricopeptide (TPR) repeat protein
MRRLPLVLFVALGVAGCGYFNSLYNANRHFAEAQRAESRGEIGTARTAYRETVEKAAASYRGHPEGRWSGDALLLIGRARFGLSEDAATAAAMRHLLARGESAQTPVAHAYLGAALLRLDSLDAALPHLDRAVDRLAADSENGAFARLWRGRALFRAGRVDEAWLDLNAAAAHRHTALEAALESAARAVEIGDTTQLAHAFSRIAGVARIGARIDTIETLLRRGAVAQPAAVLRASIPLEKTTWRADAAHRIDITRARIAADAGETELALSLVHRVINSATGFAGNRARLLAARWRLADASSVDDLEPVHSLLVSAYQDSEALQLLRHVRATQLLASRGGEGSTLATFAAAELARDELRAPRLARRLFLDFAAAAPESPWAGKAVLAAHDVAPDAETTAWIERLPANPYIVATSGRDPGDALTAAEQRLARGLTGLRADAIAEVINRDVSVGRALSAADSARAVARGDSIRIVCGTFIDSIGVKGIRADSTRAACLRSDSVRVAFVLQADTVVLLTGTAPGQRPQTPARPQVRPDTLQP